MRYILEILSRALPGQDEAFDRWYGNIHVGEVLALPGFEGCERFRRLGPDGVATGEFVAHYAIHSDDPAATLQLLLDATPRFRLTDTIDPASVRFTFLQPAGV